MKPLSALLYSMVCQLAALVLGLITLDLLSATWFSLLTAGLAAGAGAVLLRLSMPWQLFNLLLPFGVFLSFSSSSSGEAAGIAALILLPVFLPTFWTRIPFYPTRIEMYEKIAELLPEQENFSFIDLGSGFSGLLFFLAKRFPEAEFHGSEISPLPFLVSKIRSCSHKNLAIHCNNFWKDNFLKYDYIYAFLAPPPMQALWDKIEKEGKDDVTFIVNSFPVPDIKETETIDLGFKRSGKLYIYRKPGHS